MIPMSILAAVCVVEFLIPVVKRQIDIRPLSTLPQATPSAAFTGASSKWITLTLVVIVIGYGWLGAMIATATEDVNLSVKERQAMEWVSDSTDQNSRFVIISGDSWARDSTSEWFPVLADRVSVATVQGSEWLPKRAFAQRQTAYADLQDCASDAPSCIATWTAQYGETYDYLYIARREGHGGSVVPHVPCCSALVDALERDPAYSLIYQNTDATIFQIRSALASQRPIDTRSGDTHVRFGVSE